MRDYIDSINYISGLERRGIRFGLDKTMKLSRFLDNPHNNFKSILIAGTNGKGSTAAFISSILLNAGYKVGLYTSPHIESFRERIRINTQSIPAKKLIELVNHIRSVIESDEELNNTITSFEFTTVMAFKYFSDEQIDIAVIEAGMGARLDATNIVSPLLSIITDISIDHKEYLGDTVEKIAGEKAEVLKDGCIGITTANNPSAISVITEKALKSNIDLLIYNKHFYGKLIYIDGNYQFFDFLGSNNNRLSNIAISLLGYHQIQNAAGAIEACYQLKRLDFDIKDINILYGLNRTKWKGRMDVISKQPLIIIDCAHNPTGAEALMKSIYTYFTFNRLFLIIGILKDKDIDGMLKYLLPCVAKVLVIDLKSERRFSPLLLKQKVLCYNKSVEISEGMYLAIQQMEDECKQDDLILITGSIYTAGEAFASIRRRRLKGKEASTLPSGSKSAVYIV